MSSGKASPRVNIILALKNMLAHGLRQASAQLNQLAVRAREAGQAMALGAGLIGAGIYKTVSVASALDDEMRKVQARIAGVTDKEMADLTEMVKFLGRTTSFTTLEVAELASKLAQGGKNAREIGLLTEAMLNLARATGITTEQAASYTQQALASFGLGAEEAAHVADVLTYAANNSFQGVEDLGEALKYAGVIAKETGQDFETTIAGMSVMANVGIRGSMAGRQLRRVLVELGGKGSEAAKELGFSLTDVQGRIRPLPLLLADFMNATRDLTRLEKLQKFNDIFGKVGLNTSLIQGDEAKAVMKLAKELTRLQGTSKKTSDIMDGGIGGTMRRLWSAVEGSILAIGESMIPVVEKMSQAFALMFNAITPLIEKYTWLGPSILTVFTALAAGSVVLIGAAALFTTLGAALFSITTIFGLIGSAAGILVATVANPIGSIALAIAALINQTIDWGAIWRDVVSTATDQWDLWYNAASTSLNDIVDLLSKGELEKAMKLAMIDVEATSLESMDRLFGQWRGFFTEIGKYTTGLSAASQNVGLSVSEQYDRIAVLFQGFDSLEDFKEAVAQQERNIIQNRKAFGLQMGADFAENANRLDPNKQRLEELKKLREALMATSTVSTGFWGSMAEAAKQTGTTVKDAFYGISDSMMDAADQMQAVQDQMVAGAKMLAERVQAGISSFSQTASVTTGAVGAFSVSGLTSALAKSEAQIMRDQLTEQKTTNSLLTEVRDAVGSFWGN